MNTIKRFSPLALFSAFALVLSVFAAPVHAGVSTGGVPTAEQTVQANDRDMDRDDRRDDDRDDRDTGTGTGTGTGGGTGQPGW